MAGPLVGVSLAILGLSGVLVHDVFKETVTRDFRLKFFTWISFAQAPDYCMPLRSFRIFSKIRGDIRRKVFIISFRHLQVVVLAYR